LINIYYSLVVLYCIQIVCLSISFQDYNNTISKTISAIFLEHLFSITIWRTSTQNNKKKW